MYLLPTEAEATVSKRTERALQKEKNELVQKLLESPSKPKNKLEDKQIIEMQEVTENVTTDASEIPEFSNDTRYDFLEKELNILQKENEILKQQILPSK